MRYLHSAFSLLVLLTVFSQPLIAQHGHPLVGSWSGFMNRDDGPPMAEVQRAAAFQPMLAGQPSPMIGLALCRTIVHRHDGQIGLSSNARGCTFTVELPVGSGVGAE